MASNAVEVVAAIIVQNGRVFATQRGYGEYKDWWEFPGGKIEPGETAQQALAREILEELATKIRVGDYIGTTQHDYEQVHVTLHFYACCIVCGKLQLLEHEAAKWLQVNELNSVNWLPADEEILPKIAETVKKYSTLQNRASVEKPFGVGGVEFDEMGFPVCRK